MDNDDAIAIVGIGGKFPGADNIEEFWKVLVNGENHVIEVPPGRWNLDAFYSSDPDAVGKTYVRKAGFLERYDEFDNKLFGISDIEAARMDPQQRYVLECVHMALVDGGITRKTMDGTDTGVFIGFMNDDYKGASASDLSTMTNYSLTGTSPSIIAARVSYVYNLLGPSMSIDTACSSALVAIDVAVQSLKTGRCSMAICGGVNSILLPDLFVPLSRARMVSPTGQCQAFSDKADGYARGEGCGIVVLKRLGDAKKDVNKIWATIATDCNQDGHTATPITAPSGTQQEQLLKRVYTENAVDPNDIQVIEAHGTGTPVGDPIETNTLGRFFGNMENETKENERQVYISSVKSNIGHLESAAGVAGIIKVLLMMKNRTIVPSLHAETLNPKIDFDRYGFVVPRKTVPWICPTEKSRMACANCFGFGGTNSHVILKEYTKQFEKEKDKEMCQKHLVLLSAAEKTGLRLCIDLLIKRIPTTKISLCNISFTSMFHRDHFQFKTAISAESLNDLIIKSKEKLRTIDETNNKGLFYSAKVIVVFCGVGTAWKGMCSHLVKENGIVQKMISEIDVLLQGKVSWSIYDILRNSKDVLDPFISHIAIFTCQVALWSLWRYYGLKPDVVIGQSVGEVAASYAAGYLTLEQAVDVIFHRSRVLALVEGGRMFVVGNCNLEHVESACEYYKEKANIAVYNSPRSCTVSCDSAVLQDLKSRIQSNFKKEGHKDLLLKDLNVQCAYHSYYTGEAGRQLEQAISELRPRRPNLPMISTVTGTKYEKFSPNAQYWRFNVQKPVLFMQAIRAAGKTNALNIFLEIGPKPVLRAHIRDLYQKEEALCITSMKENDANNNAFQDAVSVLYEQNISLEWNKVNPCKGTLCDLPLVPLNPMYKGVFLSDITLLKNQGIENGSSSHLFVARTRSKSAMFKVTVDEEKTPFVFQHFVANSMVIPGAFYAEVALEVSKVCTNTRIQDMSVSVEFLRPFLISGKKKYVSSVFVENNSSHNISAVLNKDNEIIARFSADVIDENSTMVNTQIDIHCILQECQDVQTSSETYETLQKLGFAYGDDLKILGDAVKNDFQCLVTIHITDFIWKDVKDTHLHPAILDGLLQTPGILEEANEKRTILPAGIGRLTVLRGVERVMFGYVEIKKRSKGGVLYNMALLTTEGSVIADIKDFKVKYVGETRHDKSSDYILKWEEIHHSKVLSQKPFAEKSGICICSFNQQVIRELQNYLSSRKMRFVVLQDETLEKLKHIFRPIFHKEKEIDEIYYIPGYRMKEIPSGNEVLDSVRSSCTVLLAIVQCIMECNRTINITIITECTQSLGDHNIQDVNLFGAELWGQARSILREQDFIEFKLIDCHPSIQCSMHFIKSVIFDQNIQNDIGEIVFKDGKLFTNCLINLPTDRQVPKFRDGHIDGNCRIEVRAKNFGHTKETFCVLQTDQMQKTKLHTTFSLQKSYMHRADIYPTTGHKTGSKYLGNDEGFDIIGLEGMGNVIDNQSSKLYKEGKQPSPLVEGMAVVLYPFTVQSILTVPSSCVFSLNGLPNYKLGTFLHTTLMHALSCAIDDKYVQIVCCKDFQLQAHILQLILKEERNCKAQIVPSNSIPSPAKTITLLGKVPTETIDVLKKMKEVKSIVTYSHFIDKTQKLLLEMHDIEVSLIHSADVMSHKNLAKMGNRVDKFLKVHWMNLFPFLTNVCRINCELNENPNEVISLAADNIVKFKSIKLPENQFFRENCCYVVIGGLTGLGWEIVKMLSHLGAGEVISVSRRCPKEDKQTEMHKISKSTGCRVRSVSADICEWVDVQRCFEEIKATTTYAIKGIFHGAGILRDCLCLHMNEEQLLDVLRPKVLGTWNLHLISRQFPLDMFVMQSSMTSVMGNIGQCNYGAANAFMDCVAHYRQSVGLSGQSINWGPLAVGMIQEGSNVEIILRDQGYFTMKVHEIKRCLLQCLLCNPIQITYGLFDWTLIGKSLASMKSRLVEKRFMKLYGKEKANTNVASHSTDDLLSIVGMSSDERKVRILDVVLKVASEAFTLDVHTLKPGTFVSELGIDSMQAMTFTGKVNDLLGVRIPIVTLLSDKTSFEIITNYLSENIRNVVTDSVVDKKGIPNDTLTPMEKQFYEAYQFDAKDPSLVSYADIEISQKLADPLLWKKILTKLSVKYPLLRTVLLKTESEGNIRKKTFESDEIEIDFRVVPLMNLLHEEKLPKDMNLLLFDPSKDCPLRALFAAEGNKCMMRFVFNNLFFDLTTVLLIISDLPQMALSDDTVVSDEPNYNIPDIYKRKVEKHKQDLELYWQQYTPNCITPMSLANLSSKELVPNGVYFLSTEINRNKVKTLSQWMKKTNNKLFDVSATLYQWLLYEELATEMITFFITIDMRIHFPELKNSLCRFTNSVPLYGEIRNDSTFQSLISHNRTVVSSLLENSLLPYDDIIGFIRNINPSDVHRHQLIIEHIKNFDYHGEDEKTELIKVKRINAGHLGVYYRETSLFVWYNMEEEFLKFELAYNEAAVNNIRAKSMLQRLVDGITTIMHHPDTAISCVTYQDTGAGEIIQSKKHNYDIRNNSMTTLLETKTEVTTNVDKHQSSILTVRKESGLFPTDSAPNGYFSKRTKRGWEHLVLVKITSGEHGPVISWGGSIKKQSKNIPLKHVRSISVSQYDGKFFLDIQGKTRDYSFNTNNRTVMANFIEWFNQFNKKSSTMSTAVQSSALF